VSAVLASGLRPGALRVGVIGTGIMGTAVAADGLTLIAEAEGPGLLSVGFMHRFDPGYVDLKAAVGSDALGAALLVHCSSRGVSAGPGATSESSITGSAVHEFDTVPWLLDSPIVEVFLNARYGYAADWRPRFADAYRLQLQAWVDSVVAGTPFLRRCPRRAPPTRWPPRRCAGG
jgi:myo-inositol 2-dehydrogenase / D-chiro-inositol 1-dehydrogenase